MGPVRVLTLPHRARRCPPSVGRWVRDRWTVERGTACHRQRAVLSLPRGGRPGDLVVTDHSSAVSSVDLQESC
eukprot:462685-Alexandrium_andersonii.AAC.1